MQSQELIKYIQNPQLLSKESIPELQKLVNDFPYFQAAHLLLSLASKKWNPSVYQQTLKKTAIIATNRSHLYKLIHELENYKEPEVSITKEIEPVTKEVVRDSAKEELDILKAAEIGVEAQKNEQETTNEKSEIKKEDIGAGKKKEISVEEQIEQEVEKAIVTAFVEKEILKTNEVFKIEEKPEPESFADWLQFLKKNNGQPYAEIEEEVNKEKIKTAEKVREKAIAKEKDAKQSKEKKKAIIDKIIETNPGIIRQKEEQKFFKSDYKAKESLVENEHLVTETLAKIYALQGNIGKAIRAYEILSLKFPQKSAYFASLIQKLKSNQ